MIHLTIFIYIHEGQEASFHEYEDQVIPLLSEYNGALTLRLRPSDDSVISTVDEAPYEIHCISFDSAQDLNRYLSDSRRTKLEYLKNQSIRKTILRKSEG